jgi:uncharacterized membrane protein YfcA
MLEAWQLAIYAVVGFGMAIVSGIAGGGTGFITTPLLILFGLAPSQAISSAKFNGVATSIGSLSGLRGYSGKVNRRNIILIVILAFIIGLFAPFVIKSFQSKYYQITIGALLLAMIPIMIYRRTGVARHETTLARKTLGSGLVGGSLFIQGVFGSGAGSLVNVVLINMLGMTANEANITKRWSQLVLNLTIITGVVGAGLIVWQVVAINVCTGTVGGYIGGHISVKKGDTFAVNVLLVLMLAAGVILIAEAL